MSNGSLPPDVQVTRMARINSDIIKLCAKPIPFHENPTAQGIGLYTHVAGPKTAAENAHFAFVDDADKKVTLLPLGGLRRIQPSKFREPPNVKLAALYKEVQDAVKAEEKVWGDQKAAAVERDEAPENAYRMTIDTLKKKYGDVNRPPPAITVLQSDDRARGTRRRPEEADSTIGESSKENKVSFASQSELCRQSTSNVFMAGRNIVVERRESEPSKDYYVDRDRDPRLRGR